MSEVALVAGDGGSVSRETVRLLLERGSKVGMLAGPESGRGQIPEEVVFVPADLASPVSNAEAVATVRRALGEFTTVVTVSGEAAPGRIPDLGADEWTRCIDRTLTMTFLVARHTLDDLTRSRGSFLAVTSTGALRGVASHGAHAAAAHGVVGLIKSMAIDHARQGVRCNVVAAGHVEAVDEIESFGIAEVPDHRIPARRQARASEVARLVAHMTSERASYATGAVSVLDGGLTAGLLKEDA